MISEQELKLKCLLYLTGIKLDEIVQARGQFLSESPNMPQILTIKPMPGIQVLGMKVIINGLGNEHWANFRISGHGRHLENAYGNRDLIATRSYQTSNSEEDYPF